MIEVNTNPSEKQEGFHSTQYKGLQDILRLQEDTLGSRYVVFADINKTIEREDISNIALYTTIEDNRLGFVNVTSLSLREVVDLIRSRRIRAPHALAVKNGTRIYRVKDALVFKNNPSDISAEDFVEDEVYKENIERLGFAKEDLLKSTQQNFFPMVREEFPNINIDFQKEDRGENWKKWGIIEDPYEVVCDLEIPLEAYDDVSTAFLEFARGHYTEYSVFLMQNGEDLEKKIIKYGLFVLPKGIGKDTAINYLFNGVQATGGLFAGDSENDASAIFGDYGKYSDRIFRAIVGGASQTLLDRVRQHESFKRGFNRSWKKININGAIVPIYVESHSLVGPESLNYAVRNAVRLVRMLANRQALIG